MIEPKKAEKLEDSPLMGSLPIDLASISFLVLEILK